MIKKLTGLFLLISLFTRVSGQVMVTPDSYQSEAWDFYRLKYDTTELNVRYSIKKHASSPLVLLNPISKISYNSKFPFGYNDGAVWKGRGTNWEIHSGVSGSLGRLSYTFQPVLFFAQNNDFQLAGPSGIANPYNYQFNPNTIDWVQQYGSRPFLSFYWGQSEIKVDYKGFKMAAGTQNYTIGPARYFPILMSNNAPGMAHLNFGTDGAIPLDIGIMDLGKIEGNVVVGLMQESEYFDTIRSNDQRYYNAYHFSYQPWFIPEFTIGINKVLYMQTRYLEPPDLLNLIRNRNVPYKIIDGDTIRSGGNDFFDQMASLTGEWFFREKGFRVYFEYALNDFNSRPRILEPEHSRAYVLGFQKLVNYRKFDLVINYEHVNLSRNHTYLYRAEPVYYTHGFNRQGYTNSGQIMGSSTGPGSNADHLALKVKLKNPNLLLGSYGRRTEFNKDYFVTHGPLFRKHHVGLEFGVNTYYESNNLIFGLEVVHAYEYNRYYDPSNGQRNMYFEFSLLAKIHDKSSSVYFGQLHAK